jgi:hypothetical protein
MKLTTSGLISATGIAAVVAGLLFVAIQPLRPADTLESVTTVPATSRSPSPLGTGLDSPVIIDSSNSAAPATMVPSAGTRAPGRTSTTSPTARSLMRTVSIAPASVTRSASSGNSSASAASARRDSRFCSASSEKSEFAATWPLKPAPALSPRKRTP